MRITLRVERKEKFSKVERSDPAPSSAQISRRLSVTEISTRKRETHEMMRWSAVNMGRFSTRSKSSRDAPVVTLNEGIKHRSKAYRARSAKSEAAPISDRRRQPDRHYATIDEKL